jgi:CHAD domain-containing protein
MAYRLKPEGSPGKQLARIVRKEFERAVNEMHGAQDEVEAVYEARKRIKKIRAILRLLRDPLGTNYRTYNGELRTVAHQLSAPRDAEAAIEIMRAVHTHYPKLVTTVIFEAVRRGLTPKVRGAASRLRSTRVRQELRQAAKALPRRIRRAADPAAIRAGIAQGYARARRALRCVTVSPEDVGFHTWRRRVKDHWYHVRLLEAVLPPVKVRVRRLKRLERWLGDDHNLVLLRATLLEAPSTFGDERATSVVLGCMEKYQATLRKRALKLGERLFTSKPRAFRRSLQRRWRGGQ